MGDDVNYTRLHNDLLVLAGMHRRDFASLEAQADALLAKGDSHELRVRERSAFHLHTAERLTDAAIAIDKAIRNGVNA